MSGNYHGLTALGAAEAIKSRRMTAVDYVDGLKSWITTREPEIQAWECFDPGYVVEQAALLDARPDLSELALPGVAVGVKDIIDTRDLPTENGTPLDAGRRPSADAAVVELLREAGAIVMGKTVTTELAFMQPSKTRNPHNIEHSPGGSSSGSAAAVAAGMVPVALGTQTNGSVIRPASFCGIHALKPTNGLFPRTGVLEEAGTFDAVGVFARSLDDIAAVAQVLARGGEKQASPPDYIRAARERSPSMRFAFIKTPAWTSAEDGTKEAFARLAKALGPSCEEVTLPPEFDRAVPFHRTIMLAEIALNFGHYYERGKERLSAPMREAIEQGRGISAVDYAEALRAREQLYDRLYVPLRPYDAVITPPAAGPAPRGLDTTGNPVFCTLWTYLGVPAVNLPLLTVNGLPLGVQVVGPRFGEEGLFRAAAWLQSQQATKSSAAK
jgi:Asp-tRNA(Asn)/Glu-tRNA(Gln) amidotransferase A subunit family amidase